MSSIEMQGLSCCSWVFLGSRKVEEDKSRSPDGSDLSAQVRTEQGVGGSTHFDLLAGHQPVGGRFDG